MKTYIWYDNYCIIAIQADSLEQAVGYTTLKINERKQQYLDTLELESEKEAENLVTRLRDLIKERPIILEPFKCVIL